MKYIALLTLVFGLIFFGCNSKIKPKVLIKADSNSKISAVVKPISGPPKLPGNFKDKDEIQDLMRQMLKWADSKSRINLVPALIKDSICIGMDVAQLYVNVEKLRETGFFDDGFINNYSSIILTLDRKIKNKEFEVWSGNELPPFKFANDVDPWCLCQDNLSWDNVKVEPIKLSSDKGQFKWNWGKLDSSTDSSWKTFSYTFRVAKVDNKWKISYLEGFDYKESIDRG